ncbi:MAG: flavodoxin-dependent (E)-4-hydroxy-3-methylbut-2-enyl-diphosphate synthase [Candidatus Aminicenantes bacterium]|nr:flavodoxin-dependent (E)-4-hydroxy-3-methylbut-2-enyl-diphosphate synthase [Candidatus Aminicenantes bacterium]MCK5003589.1 flavodoxin-dependent (E)-4-hydroxy-3-methylbut-2-enyl-diphosphate synthase [Candidatus Aminicenantes bacterium]
MKREIFVGNVGIGGDHPVSIQSMTTTDTSDPGSTIDQIRQLYMAGCQIVRVAVPDQNSISSLREIKSESPIPLIADIHFNPDLAMGAIDAGVDGIRINPGNIGSREKLGRIIKSAAEHNISIRIGVNSGSIEKKYLRPGKTRAEMMVDSALDKIKLFEDSGFLNIKLSLKSSDVMETIEAYRKIDKECDYPLHLGITEAGTLFSGTIKSSIGIGSLLADGIGNTIRVSLTDDPVEEVKVAVEILKVLGLRERGLEVVSCPTCARVSVDLINIVKKFEKKLGELKLNKNIKIAIMGCEVNGPGEAKEADIGIAFSKNIAYLFRKGKMIEKLDPEDSLDRLLEIIKNI